MKNFYASNSAHAIPYRPELKLCFEPFPAANGKLKEMTTSGAVLLQQLDYWFSKYPKGFYKFLKPPSTDIPAYKPGDSWTEELCFSRREFTTAFEQIGVAYKSKKAYENAKDEGDAFQGRFYCSYYDRISRVTWYFRNHAVIDAYLDRVARTPLKGEPSESGTKQIPNSQTVNSGNDDPHFPGNDDPLIPESADRAFDYTETTDRDYSTEITHKITTTQAAKAGGGDVCEKEDLVKAQKTADAVKSLLSSFDVRVAKSKTLIKECQGKEIPIAQLNAIAVAEKVETGQVKSPQGMLTIALRENWAPSWKFVESRLSDYGKKMWLQELLKAMDELGITQSMGIEIELGAENYHYTLSDGKQGTAEYTFHPFSGYELGTLWTELRSQVEAA